jgi:hypothetical protein
MENSKSITESILESSNKVNSFPNMNFDSTTPTSDGNGFFDGIKNISLTTWLLIILILAFLGFNIFVYLAKGTQEITNFFAPIMEKIFGTAADVTGQVVDVAAEGGKAVVSETATGVNTGLTAVQDITPNNASSSIKLEPVHNQNLSANDTTLNKVLNTSKPQTQQGEEYEAHEASSSLHSGGTIGKSGWCYVGEDRGFRTCAQVGVNDKCMSGDIFPSQEVCINPSLRS